MVAYTLLVLVTLLKPNYATACQCACATWTGLEQGKRACCRAHLGSNLVLSCGSRPGAGDLDERLNGLVDVASIDVGVHRKLEELARRQGGNSRALKVAVDVRSILPQEVQGAGMVQIH